MRLKWYRKHTFTNSHFLLIRLTWVKILLFILSNLNFFFSHSWCSILGIKIIVFLDFFFLLLFSFSMFHHWSVWVSEWVNVWTHLIERRKTTKKRIICAVSLWWISNLNWKDKRSNSKTEIFSKNNSFDTFSLFTSSSLSHFLAHFL